MEKRPILLIGALKSELKYLIEMIEDSEIETKSIYKFYKGYINDYPIVIAKSEVGLVNAASCLTLAIENYNPICIRNIIIIFANFNDMIWIIKNSIIND